MIKKYIFLLLTGLIFGSQFLFIKIAGKVYNPLDIGLMRVFFGACAVLLLIPFFAKNEKPLKISWWIYAWIGLLEGTLPCILVPLGQQYVPTGIAGIIICTMPIFAMIFGPILIKDEHYDWLSIFSIIVSFIGVLILLNPFSSTNVSFSILRELAPELLILLASASWALSLVFIKKVPNHAPFKLTRNILIAATIELAIVWLLFGHPLQFRLSDTPLFSAFLLGFFGSGVVYVFYVLLIRFSGVNFAAFSNYLVPIVAGIIATVFLGEHFNWQQLVGFMIIVVGLLLQTYHDFHSKYT